MQPRVEMSSLSKILLGLSLLGSFAPLARANGAAQQQAAKQKAFKIVQGTNAKALVQKFRGKMADEIEAVGEFAGKQRDTPTMHIVPTDGAMIQVKHAAVDLNSHDIGGPGGEFEYQGPAKPTKFKVLVPVSAHYGLPYKSYAASNEYEVWVEDGAGRRVMTQRIKSAGFGKAESAISRDDLVTEVEVDLPFDKGNEFKVSFTPIATSKNGYTSGREVTIRLAP